jgi:polysaccharide pyruvyl transferase CsaB
MSLTVSVFGYYGAGNLGDELLLESTLQLLASTGIENVQIFSHNISSSKEVYPQHKLLRKFSLWDLYCGLRKSQLLVFGGGSLFQDVSSVKSLVFYFFVCCLAKICGNKLFFLGQGVGPLQTPLGKLLGRWAYAMADVVSVRDAESMEKLLSWGITATLTHDLVWQSEDPLPEKRQANAQNLLISLRPSKQLTNEHIQLLSKSIQKHFASFSINLVAFQECDLLVLEKLQKLLPAAKTHKLFSLYDWRESGLSLFQQSDYCLGMRFHALVLAAKSQVPFCGISYDPKVSSFCKATNSSCVELNDFSPESLDKQLSSLFLQKNDLPNFMNEQAKLSKEKNLLLLKQLLQSVN